MLLLPKRLRSSILWFSYHHHSAASIRPQVHPSIRTRIPPTVSHCVLTTRVRARFPISTWVSQQNQVQVVGSRKVCLSTATNPEETSLPNVVLDSEDIDARTALDLLTMSDNQKPVAPSMLAEAWTPWILKDEESQQSINHPKQSKIQSAIARTIPLLSSSVGNPASASVPFVCRYRSDVIHPLTTQQVHQVQTWIAQHESLLSLRTKLLEALQQQSDDSKKKDKALVKRILTSVSKTELDDLYAPYKPPAKGSVLEQIQKEHPRLVEALEALWVSDDNAKEDLARISKLYKKYTKKDILAWLGTKIASEPKMGEIVTEQLQRYARLQTMPKESTTKVNNGNEKVYETYHDFSIPLRFIKDHQVLAIRRGVAHKALRMGYDIDGTKVESCLKYHLRQGTSGDGDTNNNTRIIPPWLRRKDNLLSDAVHDAWTRLLRRRGTQRWWTERCKEAQDRASWVFANNLERALLAPPLKPTRPLLALDPGYQAGIKCAVLEASGKVVKLETVKFLGKSKDRALVQLQDLLDTTSKLAQSSKEDATNRVLIALGNGHGTNECRQLIQEAAQQQQETKLDLQLVNEAGASVWSVSPAASKEFPDQPAAAIASISIGRRLQNPLFELVKVPPKSLGLGMYQHDLSEKELEERLHLTCVDAVAKVGVDLNTCSLSILEKVPGLNKLAPKVAKARPFACRDELLKVTGLGPKTYENCAGFLRVPDGREALDNTLVHPESYDVARFLLRKLRLLMKDDPRTIKTISVPKETWTTNWDNEISLASNEFNVSKDRVIAVLGNIIDSILQKDPRLESSDDRTSKATAAGSVKGCSLLSSDLASDADKLKKAAPLRGIVGTVRNIADFGAFIDFGGPNDGLLHTSKLGPQNLSQLLIGQEIGVDILQVDNHRVSLGLYGLNSEPTQPRKPRDGKVKGKPKGSRKKIDRAGSKRSMSTNPSARKKRRT